MSTKYTVFFEMTADGDFEWFVIWWCSLSFFSTLPHRQYIMSTVISCHKNLIIIIITHYLFVKLNNIIIFFYELRYVWQFFFCYFVLLSEYKIIQIFVECVCFVGPWWIRTDYILLLFIFILLFRTDSRVMIFLIQVTLEFLFYI